jgi:hypothetical protein
MIMLYDIGDYVTIKTNLKVGTEYDGVMFTAQMQEFCGQMFQISHVYQEGHYNLDGISKLVSWSGDMFE